MNTTIKNTNTNGIDTLLCENFIENKEVTDDTDSLDGIDCIVNVDDIENTKGIEIWIRLMRVGQLVGCHQMPERSFFYKNYQFPVCARCTGVILATIISSIMFFKKRISVKLSLFFSSIMFLDWFIQFLKIKESTNKRRLVTGFIGGYGVATIHMYCYKFIYDTIKKFFNCIKSMLRIKKKVSFISSSFYIFKFINFELVKNLYKK